MPRRVDRRHPWKAEVPGQVRVEERRDHRAGGAVDVYGHIGPSARGQLVQGLRDVGDGLVASVEGRTQDRHDADGVVVALRDGVLRIEVVALAAHRHDAGLHVPVPAELLPAHLDVRTHDQIRPPRPVVDPRGPATLEGKAREHARLAGARRRAAGGVVGVGRVPQVREDRHAPVLELGRLRILVLVDHVLVDAVVHQLPGLRFHPGRDKGRQVEARAAVEQQLVVDELVGDVGRHRGAGEAVLRRAEPLPECGVRLRDHGVGAPGR